MNDNGCIIRTLGYRLLFTTLLLTPLAAGHAAAADKNPNPAADSREVLWTHIRTVADLGELRCAQAELDGIGAQRVLRLTLSKPAGIPYAWCSVPAPKCGWKLAMRQTVEAEIANRGKEPIKAMLWVVGRRGWSGVGARVQLAPGASSNVACRLRETFPDGTPLIDPGDIKEMQVMVAKPVAGAILEVRGLATIGQAPGKWVCPAGRLTVPDMEDGLPGAGRRVRYRIAGDEQTGIYCALYLPVDWKPGGRYPVIAEYAGNGGSETGYWTGRPEQCVIGYGMTQGRGTIWVSLPFVDRKAGTIAEGGWGSADDTADYAFRMMEVLCQDFGGDRQNLVLTGFSRGAIACGYIGLRNERIAPLWKGFHACQHYDGDGWGDAGMPGALERTRRFAGRTIFQTDNDTDSIKTVMAATKAQVTYAQSGLHYHSTAMFLDNRPSTQQLRAWFKDLVEDR